MDVWPRLQHPERLVSVSGLDDAVAGLLQHIGNEHADENLIFHDEDDGPTGRDVRRVGQFAHRRHMGQWLNRAIGWLLLGQGNEPPKKRTKLLEAQTRPP
jgi:hypothetical protein